MGLLETEGIDIGLVDEQISIYVCFLNSNHINWLGKLIIKEVVLVVVRGRLVSIRRNIAGSSNHVLHLSFYCNLVKVHGHEIFISRQNFH